MKTLQKKFMLNKSRKYLKISGDLEPMFASIAMDLRQSDTDLTLRQHIAISIYLTVNQTVMLIVGIVVTGLILRLEMMFLLKMIVLLGPLVFAMMFYTTMFRPKVKAKVKARKIEQDLPNALRHILIEVRSGIPLYQAFVAVSEGYGTVSEEFKKIVRDINGGKSETEAIEDSILVNPSLSYRRSFWQLLNAMKTGTDIGTPLGNIVDDIIKDQLISIKKYGQELNPWTLMYMMVGVIMPSLGITFMIILSTFTGTALSPAILITILVGLIFFQLIFLNLIKTKRPTVRV
ncbi:MAG: type II secretion system F family protein [archaeon]